MVATPDSPPLPAPRHAAAIGSRRWIFTLAAVTAIVALSVDISLPAQPTLAARFDVDDETAQLTLSVFLGGFGLAQIFVGYLSDAMGRRRVMLTGLAAFTLASIACAASPTIEVLIACRALEGVSAAAAPVVARAMVRDTQPTAQAARLLATMTAAVAIAPMMGPLVGGALLHLVGWRATFAALALTGLVLLALARLTLVETLPPARRRKASAGGLLRSYREFLGTPNTVLPMLIGCASFSGQFAYIADSPFVLMEGYGVSKPAFAVLFALTAGALMIGSISGGRMLRAGRSPAAMTSVGTTLLVLGGALVVIGTRSGLGIAGFIVPMVVYFFGCGLSTPSATALALAPVPHLAGTGSAAIGASMMVTGAIAGYATTRIGGSSPETFALVVAVMGVLAFVAAASARIARRAVSQ